MGKFSKILKFSNNFFIPSFLKSFISVVKLGIFSPLKFVLKFIDLVLLLFPLLLHLLHLHLQKHFVIKFAELFFLIVKGPFPEIEVIVLLKPAVKVDLPVFAFGVNVFLLTKLFFFVISFLI